ERRPKNRLLAREVISLCEAARLSKEADELTRKAVDAGNEVPELLLRYGDLLARTDFQKALPYYRQAVQGDWVPAEALIKLGKAYEDLGQTALAEACWRQAHRSANPARQAEILRLMNRDKDAAEIKSKD